VHDRACVQIRDNVELGLTVDKRAEVTVVPYWLTFAGEPATFAIDILTPHP